jgi:hypothetical protein
MYLTHKRPDVFGFMGNLEEKGRLRHYQRMLELLSREFKQYESVYTTDRSGDRIFILSKSEDVYRKYSKDIRQEYKRYPNFIYNKGRLDVLNSFFQKDRIYLTEEFSLFEESARKNIKSEINYLNSPKKRK